jgi:hypothetical protein
MFINGFLFEMASSVDTFIRKGCHWQVRGNEEGLYHSTTNMESDNKSYVIKRCQEFKIGVWNNRPFPIPILTCPTTVATVRGLLLAQISGTEEKTH